MSWYFLEPDLRAFQAQIEELRARTSETLIDMSEGTRQSSETWHDNYLFEEGQRQWKMWATQLQDWEAILAKAEIVTPSAPVQPAKIGSSVTFADEATGEAKTYRIGSYITFEPGDISYASPLGTLLMGAKVGQVKKGTFGRVEKTIKITQVS